MTTKIGLNFLDAEVANTITAAASAFDTLGANGQVLTSNGSALVWAEASGGGGSGGSFQALTRGSITAGRGVVLNSNSTVSAVNVSISTWTGTNTNGIGNVQNSNTSIIDVGLAFNPTNNHVYSAVWDPFTGAARARVGLANTSAVSWSPPVDIGSTIRGATLSYDTQQDRVLCVSSNTTATYAVVGSTIGGPNLTMSTAVSVDSTVGIDRPVIIYDPAAQKHVVFFNDGQGNTVYGEVLTLTGTTISQGTRVTINTAAGGSGRMIAAAYSSASQSFMVMYANTTAIKARSVKINGTSLDVGAEGTVYVSGTSLFQPYVRGIVYNSSVDRFMLYYLDNTTKFMNITIGKITGTDVSFGGNTIVPILGTNRATRAGSLVHFPSSNSNIVFSARNDSFTSAFDATRYTFDVNDMTATLRTSLPGVEGATEGINFGFLNQIDTIFMGGNVNRALFTGVRGATQVDNVAVLVYKPYESITNSSQWIGISGNTYSNNVTANVTILGGINEAVTGLTPNSKYYLNANGTLTTNVTSSGVVGQALANNKLLITGNAYP